MIPILIQARMGSSRLPGKVLKPWGSSGTLLAHVINECKRTQLPVWVATTDLEEDDAVAVEAAQHFADEVYRRGNPDDVLARFVGAIDAMPEEPEAVVRICADRPFLSAPLILAATRWWKAHPADYFVVGEGSLTVEIVRPSRLRKANEMLPVDSSHREHVTSFFAPAERFASAGTTVDTLADYERLSPEGTTL